MKKHSQEVDSFQMWFDFLTRSHTPGSMDQGSDLDQGPRFVDQGSIKLHSFYLFSINFQQSCL